MTNPLECSRKIFVLDTSALIHDPHCPQQFEEHDVYIPSTVLEELARKKKELFEARQAQRLLDVLTSGKNRTEISQGIPLGESPLSGKLFFVTEPTRKYIPVSLSRDVPDNQIIGAAFYLQKKYPTRKVIIVSNDIGLRLKAISNGMSAETYSHDKAIDDTSVLSSGIHELPEDFWVRHEKDITLWKKDGRDFYRLKNPITTNIVRLNEFVYLEKEGYAPFYARIMEKEGDFIVLAAVRNNYSKSPIWGILPKNRGQLFALDVLLDPDIHEVSILGQAGSGKTLLALASALHQIFDVHLYQEILMTRMMVPIGDEIGFFPGTEEEKVAPWLGALFDNLDMLCQPDPKDRHGNKERGEKICPPSITREYLMRRIKIKSPTTMRGRNLFQKFFIVDEGQNMTPKQIKTMTTRSGPGTKFVLLGNNAQIDTPYLTENTSGITYAVEKLRGEHGWKHAAHLILERGERSVLAEYAERVL